MRASTSPPCIYPTFRYHDPSAMVDWLVDVFGFSVRARHESEGVIHHAELALGSSIVMLGQVSDDAYGAIVGEPGAGQGGNSVYLVVEDPDACCDRVRAGPGEIVQELTDRDYGSREFICRDPEGNIWSVGTYWPVVSDQDS